MYRCEDTEHELSCHQKACPLRCTPPPGEAIYTKDNYSLYEIDGEEQKLYAQNLSLFAKLFLDTKSVFYDVTTFLYYLLVAHKPNPMIPYTNLVEKLEDAQKAQEQEELQVVGFFSKEKMSWDNNNLACILVFPPWQKQGLGQILMGASYEISKREGRLGGPEKRMSIMLPPNCISLSLSLSHSLTHTYILFTNLISQHYRTLAD